VRSEESQNLALMEKVKKGGKNEGLGKKTRNTQGL
jgi:hypothetical protein